MAKYSKSHERDENSKMWRGFWHSTFGILFCWVPLLGLILSISGFARQVVRFTQKHRAKMVLLILYGLVSLCISIGAICGGLYAYSRNNAVFVDGITRLWFELTGQSSLPGQGTGNNDYTGNPSPGLGSISGDFDGLIGNDVVMDPTAGLTPYDGDSELMFEGDSELMPEDDSDLMFAGGIDSEGRALDAEGNVLEEELLEESDYDFEGDDLLFDEDFEELDFIYQIVDEVPTTVDGLLHMDYKATIDKPDPTDEDLLGMFNEAVEDDGYDLHSMSIYGEEDDFDEEYTIARLEQTDVGAEPTIIRK